MKSKSTFPFNHRDKKRNFLLNNVSIEISSFEYVLKKRIITISSDHLKAKFDLILLNSSKIW